MTSVNKVKPVLDSYMQGYNILTSVRGTTTASFNVSGSKFPEDILILKRMKFEEK
jgi:hypothetical protein